MRDEGSGEPGLTLSRLIAAERNALAAIEVGKIARQEASDLRSRVERLEAENSALRQELNQVRLIAVMRSGSGPTVRG